MFPWPQNIFWVGWGDMYRCAVCTFTVVTVWSVWASWCSFTMVHRVGWGVRGCLKGTIISVMLIKHITDVTEEAWRRKPPSHLFIIIITIAAKWDGQCTSHIFLEFTVISRCSVAYATLHNTCNCLFHYRLWDHEGQPLFLQFLAFFVGQLSQNWGSHTEIMINWNSCSMGMSLQAPAAHILQ